MIRCNDEVFLFSEDDAVKPTRPVDDIKGATRATIRTEEQISFHNVFDRDLGAIMTQQLCSLGETGLLPEETFPRWECSCFE